MENSTLFKKGIIWGGGSDFCNQIIRLSFKEILNQTLKSMMFIAFNIYLMFKFDIYLI